MTIKITLPSVFFDYFTLQDKGISIPVLKRGRCSVVVELNDAGANAIHSKASSLFEGGGVELVMEPLLVGAKRTVLLLNNARENVKI